MRSLIIIFGVLLLIIAFPAFFDAVDDSITESYSQSISGVTTAAGRYAANITLGRELYNDDSTSVTSVSSNITGDSPSAASYNTTGRRLEVSGLVAGQTRTLSLTYDIDTTVLTSSQVTFITLLRWFWVFVVVAMSGGAIYAFFD